MRRPISLGPFTYWGYHYKWRFALYRDGDIDAWMLALGPIRIDTCLFYGTED